MITGFNHVAISTEDIQRSFNFYRDLIGMEVVVEIQEFDGCYDRIMNLDDAKGKVALLRLNSFALELFEFARPVEERSNRARRVSERGISHFCFNVTDIESEYRRLKEAGVDFHCPPQGTKFKATYARDPDGNVFELLEIVGS